MLEYRFTTILSILLMSFYLQAQTNTYSELQKNSNLPPRVGFEMVEFDNKFLFMGGQKPETFNPKTYYNDIWTSTDGENWTKIKENAAWSARCNFNLVVFNNHLWIIGGKNDNQSGYLNDIWKSSDGINWTLVTNKAPWETRLAMSVSVHNQKMYMIGGHSTTNWLLYQDVWESANGISWKKVGSLSDALLGVDESREGIYEHSVLKLDNTYYLIGGRIASTFSILNRVLKSTDMINWQLATDDVPWKDFDHLNLGNIRPFVHKGKLVVVVSSGLLKVSDTGNPRLDYVADQQYLFSSADGVNWQTEQTIQKMEGQPWQNAKFIFKPRHLIINNKINLYGSILKTVFDQTLDDKVHIVELTSQSTDIGDHATEKLLVYPNPANDFVRLDSELAYSLVIYDLSGKEVLRQDNVVSQVDISSLDKGIYLFHFYNDNVSLVKKIEKH